MEQDPNRFRRDRKEPRMRLGMHTRAQFRALVRAAVQEARGVLPPGALPAEGLVLFEKVLAQTVATWLTVARDEAPL